ncbi:DUF1643 domain-containing protein [Rhizobium lentis]|uniref:DUF1643 domain-containing protein n=1 Tax=Rhizobium lentis TaxID=1138194 RepID=A0A9Q3QUA0_9HYPH|nr:DUF1643 domain-containing protein [Rhizobium lentis]MBX4954386.1 DUF1643 domain-containing protein [Rhizobium lentis]MBX4972086.1 DUF1643 domain-containing protein [Rhizobium lentis]MBX4984394.1 DUF1643 domain-containing protein [Rhizobium lentis]MBX4996616.1 DUF1643 domain-containing protein [Rhizobium lentis]MBX5002627.1 DUF1643 domain-containing protein [Rhizobium lentis]
MTDLLMTRRAVFSDCGLYRYLLEHDFGGDGPIISLGMVNPSFADGEKNDHTMTKVDGFAIRLRARKVKVWNPFALIAKDVRELRDALDPVGPENDAYIAQAILGADIHIVGWGPLSKLPKPLRNRWRSVVDVLSNAGAKPMCWGAAQDGQPRHPLMLPYATPLVPWQPPHALERNGGANANR